MNKKYSILWLVLTIVIVNLILTSCISISIHRTSGKLIGQTSWTKWQHFAGWDTYTDATYKPDSNKAALIRQIIDKKKITFMLFAADWCSDSQRELPRIYKLFKATNIPESKIDLWGVDGDKEEPSGTYLKWKIHSVPTLLILKDSVEIGRIVESVPTTWEDEILGIVWK